jgi:hypothetical protein
VTRARPQVLEEYEALEKGNVAHRLYSSSMAGNKVRRRPRRPRAAARSGLVCHIMCTVWIRTIALHALAVSEP